MPHAVTIVRLATYMQNPAVNPDQGIRSYLARFGRTYCFSAFIFLRSPRAGFYFGPFVGASQIPRLFRLPPAPRLFLSFGCYALLSRSLPLPRRTDTADRAAILIIVPLALSVLRWLS